MHRLPARSHRHLARILLFATLCTASIALACSGDGATSQSGDNDDATAAPSPTATLPPPPDPTRAAQLSYAGEYEAAIDAYADVARGSSGDARQQARLAQATLLMRAERYAEARAVLDEYLAAAGAAGDASVARYMQGSALGHLGDPRAALESYERHAAAGGPLAGYARAEQALILAANARLDEARIAADEVAASGLRAAYMGGFAMHIADAFAAGGDQADALAWYAKVDFYDGDSATAHARAGAIKRQLGDVTWASDYLNTIRQYPGHGVTLGLIDELDAAGVPVSDYARGVAEYRAHRDAAARESLSRALTAGDEPAGATYYIAAIDERSGRTDDAIEGYARVPSIPGASGPSLLADNALWWRGRLLEQAGRLDEASADYGELLARFPASEWAVDAAFHRGMTLYRNGEYGAAASAWGAIAQDADIADRAKMMFWRGRAEQAAGEPQAPATFSAVIDTAPGDFYALRAEIELGRNDRAQAKPVVDEHPTDWAAIAAFVTAQTGTDPAAQLILQPEDPRWSIGASLETAGEHGESDAVLRSIIEDAAEADDIANLYRITMRLDGERRTSLAARGATALQLALAKRTSLAPPLDLFRVAYPLAYGDLVADASSREDVSPLVLLALVRQESFYDPFAGSSAGALGLTQVIEPTGRAIASELGVHEFAMSDLYRPGLSLRFGASYIGDQIRAFDGNLYHALAAYNGGPGTASNAIDAAGDDIDLFVESLEFDETKAYVKLVMENYARYRQLYAGLDRPSLPN